MPDWAAAIAADGIAIVPAVVAPSVLDGVKDDLGDSPHALRDLIAAVPSVGGLAGCAEVRGLAKSVLGPGAFVARALLFDKTPRSNWKVAWHQDLTIAVRERREVAGFGPWSVKAGIPHVQPPAEILERMLTLRIHLDPCGEGSGPLRVIPGSHLAGKLDPDAIAGWRRSRAEVPCLAEAGGIVIMRPLLLHASSPAIAPGHRRVVHLEFAAEDLPCGLEWRGRS